MTSKYLIAISILFFFHKVIAASCYETSILKPAPFLGNDGEIIKLSDGTIWEVKYEYNYMYEYYPEVIICPNSNTIIVNGKKIQVQPLN